MVNEGKWCTETNGVELVKKGCRGKKDRERKRTTSTNMQRGGGQWQTVWSNASYLKSGVGEGCAALEEEKVRVFFFQF